MQTRFQRAFLAALALTAVTGYTSTRAPTIFDPCKSTVAQVYDRA